MDQNTHLGDARNKKLQSQILQSGVTAEQLVAIVAALTGNISEQAGGASTAAAGTIEYPSNPGLAYTLTPILGSTAGSVEVNATGTVDGSGGTGVAGDEVTWELLVDGATSAGAVVVTSLDANKLSTQTLTFIIEGLSTAVAHHFQLQASCGGGHTIGWHAAGAAAITAKRVA